MTQNSKKDVSRRTFIGAAGGLAAAFGLSTGGWALSLQSESTSQSKIKSLEIGLSEKQRDLEAAKNNLASAQKDLDDTKKKWIIYGGGSNVKLMPDPSTKQPTVALEEVFAFSKNFAFCRVDNNPKAFRMPTHSLGEVTIDANSFYMVMVANLLLIDSVTPTPTGGAKAILKGSLDCATEVGSAGTKVGSRTVSEPADFEIEAVDDRAGDKFAFIVFFDEKKAPVNYSIFGPKAIFTGDLKTGGVVVKRIADI